VIGGRSSSPNVFNTSHHGNDAELSNVPSVPNLDEFKLVKMLQLVVYI